MAETPEDIIEKVCIEAFGRGHQADACGIIALLESHGFKIMARERIEALENENRRLRDRRARFELQKLSPLVGSEGQEP